MNWLKNNWKNIVVFVSVGLMVLFFVLWINARGTYEEPPTQHTASPRIASTDAADVGGRSTSTPGVADLPGPVPADPSDATDRTGSSLPRDTDRSGSTTPRSSDPTRHASPPPSATVSTPSGQAAVNTGNGTIIQISGQGNTVHFNLGAVSKEEGERLMALRESGKISSEEFSKAVEWWNERTRLIALAEKAKAEGNMDEYYRHHDARLILDFPFVKGITVYALRTSNPSLYNHYGKFEFVVLQYWKEYYRRPMTMEQVTARAAFYVDPSDGQPFTWRQYLKEVLWPEWTGTDGVLDRFAGTGTAPDDFNGVRYFVKE